MLCLCLCLSISISLSCWLSCRFSFWLIGLNIWPSNFAVAPSLDLCVRATFEMISKYAHWFESFSENSILILILFLFLFVSQIQIQIQSLVIRLCPRFYSLFDGAVFAVMLMAFVICVLISLNDLWGVWELNERPNSELFNAAFWLCLWSILAA